MSGGRACSQFAYPMGLGALARRVVQFAVQYRHRHNDDLRRDPLIDALVEVACRDGAKHRVGKCALRVPAPSTPWLFFWGPTNWAWLFHCPVGPRLKQPRIRRCGGGDSGAFPCLAWPCCPAATMGLTAEQCARADGLLHERGTLVEREPPLQPAADSARAGRGRRSGTCVFAWGSVPISCFDARPSCAVCGSFLPPTVALIYFTFSPLP